MAILSKSPKHKLKLPHKYWAPDADGRNERHTYTLIDPVASGPGVWAGAGGQHTHMASSLMRACRGDTTAFLATCICMPSPSRLATSTCCILSMYNIFTRTQTARAVRSHTCPALPWYRTLYYVCTWAPLVQARPFNDVYVMQVVRKVGRCQTPNSSNPVNVSSWHLGSPANCVRLSNMISRVLVHRAAPGGTTLCLT